ncbi:UDP-glucose 4-epimerase [Granulibacter bethesdensis]|uniref:UDP-glucose 4-epimerase n=2 Tax=Granulibacter bethesdensis TaxID=364410 RepID=A0AAC9KER2_9PROT|nr:UDP-glucose 4-epimerase [Granulibacter bethesdensis]APH62509.1 UDP-glucose 4-epimerase [Granulibacter bethesdensis]
MMNETVSGVSPHRPLRLLVTGGAGYVGSHTVWALHDRGDEVTVYDSLIQGHRQALPPGVRLVVADLADETTLHTTLADGQWDGVLHFAARSLVGESMVNPMLYMNQNAALGFKLIEACVQHKVPRFILSSTAALFGHHDETLIDENAAIQPGSPYGESKLMIERALSWADRIHGLRYACLRYFNAAGADPEGRSGEDHDPETHLIPLVIDAALGLRPEIRVFGNDYPTRDGTCIRDYIHVSDLAQAHLAALTRIDQGSTVYNLGNGAGSSVMEVIRSVERVSSLTVPMRIEARRPGDPAVLVASADKIRRETGWTPRFPHLDDIVATALAWRRAHPQGFEAS